ncbi:MAG: outer membrane lipid asymmetry maintenance protein MlaD [Alphaproteobacteria bacterium]|nr:MAG: outer membrane lipid asymmetry maintenance protein MlaD [Alphaproteobacteria bacterium]
MKRNVIETVIGAVVLAVAAFFLSFAYRSADLRKVEGYEITAAFPNIEGLHMGSDVRINGVKVGTISSQVLNPKTFLADVRFTLAPEIRIPSDTVAVVASEGLLGGRYLSLEIGVEEDLIANDGTGKLTRTQPPMRLEDLIGQVVFSRQKSGEGAAPAPAAAPVAVPAPAPALTPSAPSALPSSSSAVPAPLPPAPRTAVPAPKPMQNPAPLPAMEDPEE